MSEKEPYKPTEEEIKKAEEMMTDKQSELSSRREKRLSGDSISDDAFLYRGMKIFDDAKIMKEDRDGFLKEIPPEEVLAELDEYENYRVRQFEEHRDVMDQIHRLRGKVLKLKEKQEKKES